MNSLILLLAITTGPSTFPVTMPTTEATTAPATAPTTMASTVPSTAPAITPTSVAHPAPAAPVNPLIPRPMPTEYALLLNRSMFVRGHVAFDTHRPGTQPPRIAATEPSLARPETTFVFNGVTVANGAPVAFIEDTANQKVLTVQVGQSIAQGKITDITLDSLSYRNSTRTVVLQIGQDLSGNDAVPSMEMPTTGPAESGSDITAGGDSILERMKRKRAQELQGK